MARFHINPSTGEPGQCRASTAPCPFGSMEEHFPTQASARAHYEKSMEGVLRETEAKMTEKEKLMLAKKKAFDEAVYFLNDLSVASLNSSNKTIYDTAASEIKDIVDSSDWSKQSSATRAINSLRDKLDDYEDKGRMLDESIVPSASSKYVNPWYDAASQIEINLEGAIEFME